jgi:hypothetical protein
MQSSALGTLDSYAALPPVSILNLCERRIGVIIEYGSSYPRETGIREFPRQGFLIPHPEVTGIAYVGTKELS